ncbi:MAG: 2'-5' RNA ligase family protein [Limisphaerales bacterium]
MPKNYREHQAELCTNNSHSLKNPYRLRLINTACSSPSFQIVTQRRKIIDLGSTLRQTHRLQGRLRPTTHLHVSLLPLGGASDVSATVVEAIGQVCKKVTKVTRPFEIEFNRVMRFRTANALVLADVDRKNTEVINLRESLCAEFAKYFPSRRPLPRFIPHLTLLYDKQELASQAH